MRKIVLSPVRPPSWPRRVVALVFFCAAGFCGLVAFATGRVFVEEISLGGLFACVLYALLAWALIRWGLMLWSPHVFWRDDHRP